MIRTLADLLAPVTPEQFFAEYYDKQPLHVQGGAAKFAPVLSWRQINRLLDQTHIWSSQSLKLVMDGTPVPPEQYCTRATSRDNAAVATSTSASNTTDIALADGQASTPTWSLISIAIITSRDAPTSTGVM